MFGLFRYAILRLLGRHKTLFISPPSCFVHDVGSRHPEAVGRLEALERALWAQNVWPSLYISQAEPVSEVQLSRVHMPKYIRSLEATVPPPGKISRLDDDTVMSHDTLTAARYASGAVVKAVRRVLNNKAPNAFCAVRPPGHHAGSDKAGGFCFFNHVAVGAMYALAEFRIKRIAIVDFDIHHGDGTEEIFRNDERVMLLSLNQPDLYPFQREAQPGSNPNRILSNVGAGLDSETFRDLVKQQWLPTLRRFRPELILLSAGFDAHRDDSMAYGELQDADYAWITHKLMQEANRSCGGRLVSVLEGGYDLGSLARSVAAHVYVLAGLGKPSCVKAYEHQKRLGAS